MKQQEKDPAYKLISGVGVQLDHTDFRKASSAEELKKLETFSHLPEDKQDKAYDDLYSAVQDYKTTEVNE